MLEHSAMYLNVTPPYEEDTSFFPDFYTTRLGPCELQDPVWAKMSALAAGVNKKRKKSETKPQAQINKCNNEKRRREQENIYIEELAELISANFADMSSLSVKPDKCAILQEAVNQIRSIKQETAAQQQTQVDPVQQGEVSSSRPTILSNELYGPLLLEALEGFLFVVNSEGKVEHVTENVSTYIKFTKEEVLGKSIYNFIHLGDHAKFHSNLLPMTIEWGNDQQQVFNRSKSIDIRLLVKLPDDLDETVEEKQQRINSYELMHISSTQLRDQLVSEEDGSDSGPCLLCVASRISHREKTTCNIEQFTTKLDTSGKIICVDTSGIAEVTAQYIKELRNRVLRELVPQQEAHKVNAHLRETVNAGLSTSAIYRLQIGQDKFIQVQTKSKLFKTHAANDSDFIMATHSIVSENDAGGPTDPGGGGGSGGAGGNTTPTNSNASGIGGPLMTSVVNGTASRNGTVVPISENSTATSSSSSSNSLLNPPTAFNTPFSLENDFNLEFFPSSSTWPDLEPSNWESAAAAPRPDSRHGSATPGSRPPSNPSYSNAAQVQSSPYGAHAQQSPSVANPATPASYGGSFAFSPLNDQTYPLEEQKETKNNVEETTMLAESSTKLRILLTGPDENRDRILKELLNRKDDDVVKSENRNSPRTLMNRTSMPAPSEPPKTSSNNMLLQLLNDKSSDDEESKGAGVKNKSELLQILMKPEKDVDDERKNDEMDDKLLRSLGFPPSLSDRSRKRPGEDKDDGPNKRSSDGSQVTTSLRERNKMLASLLAKQPANNQPIPPVPAHVICATPQEKLPKITGQDPSKTIQQQMGLGQQQQQGMATMANSMGTARMHVNNRMQGRPSLTTNYLSTVLSANNNNSLQRNDVHLLSQINSNYIMPVTSTMESTLNNNSWQNSSLADLQMLNDPLLSDILDEVIEFAPDHIMRMPDDTDLQKVNCFQTSLDKTMAIEFIQKSLMQCESAMKSPASPIGMSGTPPAYSSSGLTNQGTGVFPPPPNYSQAKFQQRMRAGSQQYAAAAGGSLGSQLLLQQQQQQRKLQQQQQQEQKRRLLMQQKQQQLLIPSNAAAASEINAMQNIDSLLNNTVAPNVSLQRSSSVPESQLSPGYGQTQRQQPYSPHSQLTSPLGQQPFPQTTGIGNYQNPGARLSPQSQFSSQLSPRQAYPQANAASATASWQQTQARLTLQQNPMLSAQLTRPPQQQQTQQQQQQQQSQQRSIQSPGGSVVPTRHSPYPPDQFPPPSSPTSVAFNSQYLRLQRANSAPNAVTQLPGVNTVAAAAASAPTSEFVRQELRAVVGARTAQAQPGAVATSQQVRAQQQHQQQQQTVSDLDSLGITFEMATGASDSPKLWGAMGSEMGSMSPQPPANSRNSMEEGRQGDQKSSLLQKLLSE